AASYQLVDDYNPRVNFFDKFFFYNDYDPTYGHVKYVNKTVALANGYAHINDAGQAIIKPDTTNLWPPGYADGVFAPGRPSVRVESLNTYTHGLFIFDATHLPAGCGTWPAYWLLGPAWPSNGEIDIIEGVNTYPYDAMTLHTTANCSVAGSDQSGALYTISCEGGCGSELNNETADPNNYGAGFNANQGGIYATEWTSDYIRHWWFPRGTEPQSITNGVPDVSTFGTPAVNHQGSCDMDAHFANMSIIVNIDFCGAWAGGVYQSQYPNCPQDVPKTVEDTSINRCTAFVGGYPQNLTEAYWEINRIKVYQ
ncbi:glycoside hydrolase family 16 protein, partial [Dothistroma septosporum NZE10]